MLKRWTAFERLVLASVLASRAHTFFGPHQLSGDDRMLRLDLDLLLKNGAFVGPCRVQRKYLLGRRGPTLTLERTIGHGLECDNDPRKPKPGFQPRQFLTTPITTTDFGTNMAAMLSLNLIACLALAPGELPEERSDGKIAS